MLTLNDIKIGDTVKLDCEIIFKNIRNSTKYITGIVEDVFDELFPDHSEGNLVIIIKYNQNSWLRYKPSKDGGTIQILERK